MRVLRVIVDNTLREDGDEFGGLFVLRQRDVGAVELEEVDDVLGRKSRARVVVVYGDLQTEFRLAGERRPGLSERVRVRERE